MSESHTVNLSKQTLPQLQELLERQESLMRNKNILQSLKDKGESVKKLHEKILKEIQHRKEMFGLEDTLSNLTLSNDKSNADFLKEKHVEYVCSKEKPIQNRYLPHRTLTSEHENPKSSTENSPKKPKDITAASEPKLVHEPTKLIPLSESLVIENEQAHRILEEKAKKALGSLVVELLDNESTSSNEEDNVEKEILIEES